jgi:phosphatidylserine/phosphatidylglycerophosphate/cardiolipin synthase-like enzyme
MKKTIPFFLLAITFSFTYFYADFELPTLTTDQPEIDYLVQDQGDIQLYFCPHEDCETALLQFIDSAQEYIHCALFEVGLESIQEVLLEKEKQMEVQVVVDNNYLHKYNHSFVKADTWGLMHNKFCIIDGVKVSSGSMNPTNNGANKNNNNLLLINSEVLTANYQAEFYELWNGTFKKGDKVLNPSIMIGDIKIRNYFCPEDDCAERVKDELKKAKKSVKLMTFSFTHDSIGNILLLMDLNNISIEGVMEARQVTKYSQYERLINQDIDVIKDGNKQNMHHKVFIIDDNIVVTGSFNPTNGGNEKNDENILIIEDKEITAKFIEEYEYVRKEAEDKLKIT